MKHLKLILLVFVFTVPNKGFSQKAFDKVYYSGAIEKMNVSVRFIFANGYFDASAITVLYTDKKKNIHNTFYPEPNRTSDTIKFIHQAVKGKSFNDYFKLKDVKEDYVELPKTILGTYYYNGMKYNFVLSKIK